MNRSDNDHLSSVLNSLIIRSEEEEEYILEQHPLRPLGNLRHCALEMLLGLV
jgi:hypothetical protein